MTKLSLAFLVALAPSVSAQPTLPRVQTHNLHGWWSYAGDHPLGNSKWGLHLETQVRRHNVATQWQQLLIRPAVNYSIKPNVMVSAGYGYIATSRYGDYPVAVPFPEHRFYEQLQITEKLGRVGVVHRLRLEQRELGELRVLPNGDREHTRWRHENRLRYMYRVLIPIQGRWSIAIYDEVLINFGKNVANNVFDQNRLYGAIGYNLPKKSRLEVGYLEQTLQQRNGRVFENNHTIMVTIFSGMPFGHRND